jgi:hypothetical protein
VHDDRCNLEGVYLGSASRAAKSSVSRTVSEPTNASSCSTKLDSFLKSPRSVAAPFKQRDPRTEALVARWASRLRSVVLPEPLMKVRNVPDKRDAELHLGPMRASISPVHVPLVLDTIIVL